MRSMRKQYEFEYNVFYDNSPKEFKAACLEIEEKHPEAEKQKLLVDVDGSTIQIYCISGKEILVFDDYEVGAVYVDSDYNLDDIFERQPRPRTWVETIQKLC